MADFKDSINQLFVTSNVRALLDALTAGIVTEDKWDSLVSGLVGALQAPRTIRTEVIASKQLSFTRHEWVTVMKVDTALPSEYLDVITATGAKDGDVFFFLSNDDNKQIYIQDQAVAATSGKNIYIMNDSILYNLSGPSVGKYAVTLMVFLNGFFMQVAAWPSGRNYDITTMIDRQVIDPITIPATGVIKPSTSFVNLSGATSGEVLAQADWTASGTYPASGTITLTINRNGAKIWDIVTTYSSIANANDLAAALRADITTYGDGMTSSGSAAAIELTAEPGSGATGALYTANYTVVNTLGNVILTKNNGFVDTPPVPTDGTAGSDEIGEIDLDDLFVSDNSPVVIYLHNTMDATKYVKLDSAASGSNLSDTLYIKGGNVVPVWAQGDGLVKTLAAGNRPYVDLITAQDMFATGTRAMLSISGCTAAAMTTTTAPLTDGYIVRAFTNGTNRYASATSRVPDNYVPGTDVVVTFLFSQSAAGTNTFDWTIGGQVLAVDGSDAFGTMIPEAASYEVPNGGAGDLWEVSYTLTYGTTPTKYNFQPGRYFNLSMVREGFTDSYTGDIYVIWARIEYNTF